MTEPHIEIAHKQDFVKLARLQGHQFDLDSGTLGLPKHIAIGQKTWDGEPITCYGNQVDEYGIWLEDQVKAQNISVLQALDQIYNLALGAGVILVTSCQPNPYITHAHKVRDMVMDLAANVAEETGDGSTDQNQA